MSKRNQRPSKSVILVGMMGVGKSSIGRRLANRLHMPFVDADTEIESAANMTIAAIFENYGEAHFRDGERRVIARLIADEPRVIATGGGAFANDKTRALILSDAISIWLDADIDVLVERVAKRGHRPLLRHKSEAQIKATLLELGTVRNPLYAMSDIHIKSDQSPRDQTVDAIVQALRKRN